MRVIQNDNGNLIKDWSGDLDEKTLAQLRNTANLPFIHKWVAAMPDTHFGLGATVGSVVPTKGAIIPAAVGVDIGCGMMASRLNIAPDDIDHAALRALVENTVPVGFARHDRPVPEASREIAMMHAEFLGLTDRFNVSQKVVNQKNADALTKQVGTLGGGNHFIEFCEDENGEMWLMLHSGSRGIGNQIGQYFIELAKEDMRRYFINLPDMDLAYLPEGTEHFNAYWSFVQWAQKYALLNRKVMLGRIINALTEAVGREVANVEAVVSCHHNYVEMEHHYGENVYVTRKGAVRARAGDMGIIPGSMGAKSYIVRGKGNPESFHSCSHGAGRRMSRSEARKQFTEADLASQTVGVECRKDSGVVDEIPAAYKDIDIVMANQADLVEVVHTLKQFVCVKG